jgi:hypothetical protein
MALDQSPNTTESPESNMSPSHALMYAHTHTHTDAYVRTSAHACSGTQAQSADTKAQSATLGHLQEADDHVLCRDGAMHARRGTQVEVPPQWLEPAAAGIRYEQLEQRGLPRDGWGLGGSAQGARSGL